MHRFWLGIGSILLILDMARPALAEFVFERAIPPLSRDWYFRDTWNVQVTPDGGFVTHDYTRGLIRRYTRQGDLVTSFGSLGSNDDQFSGVIPSASPSNAFLRRMAINQDGDIFIADSITSSVKRFSQDGEHIISWSIPTPDPRITIATFGQDVIIRNGRNIIAYSPRGELLYQLSDPEFFANDLAADSEGGLWVTAGSELVRLQIDGTETNRFAFATCSVGTNIAVGADNSIYVTGTQNSIGLSCPILRYDRQGNLLAQLAPSKWLDFSVYDDGDLIGTDQFGVETRSPEGRVKSRFSQQGIEAGVFDFPKGIATDSAGNIFVPDRANFLFSSASRIQKFDDQGNFLTSWSVSLPSIPTGIAVRPGNPETVLVAEDVRLAEYDLDGQFLGNLGDFNNAWSVATNPDGRIYVGTGDSAGLQGQVFQVDSQGQVISQWNASSNAIVNGIVTLPDGGFAFSDLFLIQSGNTSSATSTLRRINGDGSQRFLITEQGITYNGLTLGADGRILAAIATESGSGGIRRLDEDGTVIELLGREGRGAGDFGLGRVNREDFGGLALNEDALYVAEIANSRVSKLVNVAESDDRAIVVAGGGPYTGNTLWAATRLNSSFAYNTLRYQGFSADRIQYLSAESNLDLNGDSIPDVDGDATLNELSLAITQWASDASNVVIYLVDHGGDRTFRLGADELLPAQQLDDWLDQLQSRIPGRITVVYDACRSGSFLDALAQPGSDRVIISSAAADQSAFFVDRGSLSFSSLFWTQIFDGASIETAYLSAQSIISSLSGAQNAQLDANGDGLTDTPSDFSMVRNRFFGNGAAGQASRPQINSITVSSQIANGSQGTITVDDVSDPEGVRRVWAVIKPPGFEMPSNPNDPVRGFPSVELSPTNIARTRWDGVFSDFDSPGTYVVSLNAADRFGNRAIPVVEFTAVLSPETNRVMIVQPEPSATKNHPGGFVKESILRALIDQGLLLDSQSILLAHPSGIDDDSDIDGDATSDSLVDALDDIADLGTGDLTLVLIADQDQNGNLMLDDGPMTIAALDQLLDQAQDQIAGTLTVIYDGPSGADLIPTLMATDTQKRIVITSTESGQTAQFFGGGEISFTNAFWEQVGQGSSTRQAFQSASRFLQNAPSRQIPVLEDNSNGFGNDGLDGTLADTTFVGSGLLIAGDPPLINQITDQQSLNGSPTATIEVSNITTTGRIDRVFAVVTAPGSFNGANKQPIAFFQELQEQGDDRYRLSFNEFNVQGQYQISVYATDEEGQISQPATTTVIQQSGVSATGIDINSGFSGAWFDPDSDGQGWLIEIIDDTTALVFWFTYPPLGQGVDHQTWIGAQVGRIEGSSIIIEQALTLSGARFGNQFNSDDLNIEVWGDLVFNFTNCSSGEMTYEGRHPFGPGRLELVRLTSLEGVDCTTGNVNFVAKPGQVDARMSGAWFDTDRNGEGWLLEILPDDVALTVWFTYDTDGRQQWLIGVGAVNGNTINFELTQKPVGSSFGSSFDPNAVDRNDWGSLSFVFEDCKAGTVNYAANDVAFGSGSIAIVPLTKVKGLECEQ